MAINCFYWVKLLSGWMPCTLDVRVDSPHSGSIRVDESINIVSQNLRYFVEDVPNLTEDGYRFLQLAYVNTQQRYEYLRLLVKVRHEDYAEAVELLTIIHQQQAGSGRLLNELTASGKVHVPSHGDCWAELDKEAFGIYANQTDPAPLKMLFFHAAVSHNVINRIYLEDDNWLHFNIGAGNYPFKVQFYDGLWKTCIPLIKPVSADVQLPYLPSPKVEGVEERRRSQGYPAARGGQTSGWPNPANEEKELQDALWASELASYSSCVELDSENPLGMLWTVAEGEMGRLIDEGKVAYSSIDSSGLDPNSVKHFQKCVDEIYEEIMDGRYDLAVSHYFGTKRTFQLSENAAVCQFFEADPIETLKRIFIRKSLAGTQ